MSGKQPGLPALPESAGDRFAQAVLSVVATPPGSNQAALDEPEAVARRLLAEAARKAALTAGGLALPPGPLGWLTILPELLAVWRIQAQLVADLAALYGQGASLGREQMLYCLFRHTAAQALRDLAVRTGERASAALLQRVATAIGVQLSQRTLAKSAARWLPMIGAAGVAAYAFWDTQQVGRSAQALFERQRRPRAPV
ncbi:hypothetical protein RQP53_15460 [Paucibacter sp. APW11]|uniref:EcsC family protein n=1 Tax=Roseateles aquae TaxID=3077235 RepID=A0ABU3PEG1_9BURK|nr:hypothetical protein [Paucibacter sp. APW11]MDT9000672.1 hypothetical protein [Paucibacter sp. APW11]